MTKNVYVFKNEDEWFKFSLKEWFTFLLQGNRELPKNKQIFRFPRIPTDDDQVWKETPGVFVITFGSDEHETRHVSVQGWSEAEWRSEKESVGGEFKSSFAKCIVCNDDKLNENVAAVPCEPEFDRDNLIAWLNKVPIMGEEDGFELTHTQ